MRGEIKSAAAGDGERETESLGWDGNGKHLIFALVDTVGSGG